MNKNDTWNTAGVSWSNENIEQELARVEALGKRLADKFFRDKLIFVTVATIALFLCALFMESGIALIVEVIILFVSLGHLRKAGRRAMAPMYRLCDPYMEFAYIRAYAEKRMPKTRTAAARQVLSLAQCMGLAGEPRAALEIQKLVDVETLKPAEKSIYYNTQLLCYGQYGWTGKRMALTAELRELREKSGKKGVGYLDLILNLEEVKRRQDVGDIEYVENYFKQVPPVFCFQEVGMHYSLGMMYIKAGDAERAREHVKFVLDNGNKLYYKKNLEDYLKSSLEGN